MAEVNKDKTKNLEWHMFCKNTKTLLDAMIDCERKRLFFNGLSHSEKVYAINMAVENGCRLNALKTTITGLLKYQDPKLIELVESYVAFKSRLCYFINMLSIEKILLKDAKAEAIEEKLNLESQLDPKFQSAEIGDKKSEQNKEEATEQRTDSSERNKIEIYSPHNTKGNTDAQEYNDSKRFYDESQSMKQNSIYELHENGTKYIKRILLKDELENTIPEETFQSKMEKISSTKKKTKSPDTLLLKSTKLKLDKSVDKHRNENMAIEKDKVQKVRKKQANKTSKSSYKEEKIIEFEKYQQNLQTLLKRLNSDIEDYETELTSVEKALKYFIEVVGIVSLETFELNEIFSEVSVEDFMYESETDINYTIDCILALQSRKGTNIMKDAINFIFDNEEKANVSNGNILRVKHYSSMAESKPRDTSSLKDDSFYVHLGEEDKNYGPDNLVFQLNKNGIFFQIDTDGSKTFEVDDTDLFSERKSTKVVLNYADEKVKISFIDNQIVISTENSELDIFINRPQPDDLQDDGTQTVTGH